MPTLPQQSAACNRGSLGHAPSGRAARPGFSLFEVMLALGVMGLAVISILGLVAPTLGFVKQAQEINAGTTCIEKMNTILETAQFWDTDTTLANETVWQWIRESDFDSPTVFIFYDEIPPGAGTDSNKTPLQRVVRYNLKHNDLNTPLPTMAVVNNYANDPAVPSLPVYRKMEEFVQAVAENRISGPVIAMTLSLSPLVKNFPATGPDGDERRYYGDPPHEGLFPVQIGLSADPSGRSDRLYPEGYLPIYVQAFTVPTSNIQSQQDAAGFGQQLTNSFTGNTRLFTYTTAKLR